MTNLKVTRLMFSSQSEKQLREQSEKQGTRQLQRDIVLKDLQKFKIDQYNKMEENARKHQENHAKSKEATVAFYVNKNALHAYRHHKAVEYREKKERERMESICAEADATLLKSERFVERRERILGELSGKVQAHQQAKELEAQRGRLKKKVDLHRQNSLEYCGPTKYFHKVWPALEGRA